MLVTGPAAQPEEGLQAPSTIDRITVFLVFLKPVRVTMVWTYCWFKCTHAEALTYITYLQIQYNYGKTGDVPGFDPLGLALHDFSFHFLSTSSLMDSDQRVVGGAVWGGRVMAGPLQTHILAMPLDMTSAIDSLCDDWKHFCLYVSWLWCIMTVWLPATHKYSYLLTYLLTLTDRRVFTTLSVH